MTEKPNGLASPATGMACSLVMACNLDQVRLTAAAARAFLLKHQVSPSDADACELALVEACNNAVLYAPTEKRDQPIRIEISCHDKHLEFQVRDHTPGFELPRDLELPSPEEEHGRGLFIIRASMDEVAYLRGAEENRLILRKVRSAGAERESQHATRETASGEASEGRLAELERRAALSEQAMGAMAKELCFRSEALHAIFRSSSELGRGNCVEDFADRLLHDLLRIAEADWFVLRLVSSDRASLQAQNLSNPELQLKAVPLAPQPQGAETTAEDRGESRSVERKAVLTRREVLFGPDEPLAAEDPLRAAMADTRGFVRPIFQGDTLLGTLAVGRKSSEPPFSPEQTEVIRTFSEFLGIQIANADLHQRQVDVQVTAHELEIARTIQESLLPKFFPPVPGFGLAGFCLSARHVGGDFYDVFEVARGRVLLVVADVMGKGIPAALFAATLHTLVRTMAEWTHEPAELLARMNAQMFEELSAVDMFITAQLVLVDTEKNLLTVASAGHCPLLVAMKSGEKRSCAPEGLPLGILPRAIFTEAKIQLDDCSAALLYTDGLTEARNVHGEFFGQQRLEKWLHESSAQSRSAYELSWKFMADFKAFQSQAATADDQTFLILAQESPTTAEIAGDSEISPSLILPVSALSHSR